MTTCGFGGFGFGDGEVGEISRPRGRNIFYTLIVSIMRSRKATKRSRVGKNKQKLNTPAHSFGNLPADMRRS